ncbi:D-alanyl-D-alanine carboxypeptidase/D-alanyl-D-alanine-endopeptidase [Deinococcus aquiradiocola]|uniref:D-alanyl-D-alanine carboxypeptidase n=1 Tax=Deinococcus aquiradiocola TaxID=393059 RepID=A0A917PLA7_9DEIO|nr:D-alanyl-D-alanine carboxypeptidase [Deinococcus aquiradiocola]GGJ83635.1 D-alanyl-D-alanine carboxypeptidase [Deinococcus aquiradiocola]
MPSLSRRLLTLPLLALLGSGAGQGQPPTPTPAAQVAAPLPAARVAALDAALRAAGNAHVGVLVADAQTGETLYARRDGEAFTPASNMKLLSLGTVLDTLGGDYWFSTTVTRPAGTGAHADHLTLVGSGDPSLEAAQGEHSLAGLARQVYRSGVHRVDALHLDPHLIGAPAGTDESGWSVPVAERPVTGLTLNDPTAGEGQSITTTPDTRAALRRLGGVFRQELRRAGVTVGETVTVTPAPMPGVKMRPEEGVATTRSAPLLTLVQRALKRSDNVWTEQLYARLGVNTGTPVWRPASPRHARAQEERLLTAAGAPLAGLVVRDGSGLSGQDRLTPRLLVGLLRWTYLHAQPSGLTPLQAYRQRKNPLIEALPRAGTGTATRADTELGGTLASRLAGLDVRAKTGTLPGVSSLSGYLGLPDTRPGGGRVLVFSILMDRYAGPGQDLRRVQDTLLRTLAAPPAAD